MASRPAAGMPVSYRLPASGQRENGQLSTEIGVVAQLLVAADRAQPVGVLLQARRHADAGPAADAGEHAYELLAAVLIGEHVADDPRRGAELPQLLAGVDVNGLEVAFQRAVEHDVARGG